MNEYFAQTLAEVLEETASNMGNKMVLDHLSKNGTVSFEEAEFYKTLCMEVLTEAADEFIPEELDVPEAPAPEAPIELFDAVGNKYLFQNGQLIPVDAEEEEMAPEEPEMAPEDAPEAAPEAAPVQESTEVEGEVLEESEAPVEEIIEESNQIVARILANMK